MYDRLEETLSETSWNIRVEGYQQETLPYPAIGDSS